MNDIEILKNKGSKYQDLFLINMFPSYRRYPRIFSTIFVEQIPRVSKYLPRETSIHTCPIESRGYCPVRCYVQD